MLHVTIVGRGARPVTTQCEDLAAMHQWVTRYTDSDRRLGEFADYADDSIVFYAMVNSKPDTTTVAKCRAAYAARVAAQAATTTCRPRRSRPRR